MRENFCFLQAVKADILIFLTLVSISIRMYLRYKFAS